ncbi:MAG: MATE family efflux transporter [Clostridia bacterium]|nr:MATE family efflux transporter [Clostridia bacterium]
MKAFARSKDINMLEGPLLGKVFLFALPLMATNLLQMLYNAADMIVAGMSGVEGAIGSIGTTGAMINFILNIFSGFAIGTNVVVARNIGRGDKEATEQSVHTSLVMAALFGAICAVVGLFVSRPVLKLLGDEGHVLELATLYTRIYFAGAPFLAVSNYMIAILRAKGDTRTPLYILTATGLLNVGMNLFFVLVMKMSVDGVAYATVIANAANVVILGIVPMRDPGWCRVELKKLRITDSAMKEIVRDGLPAGIQGMLFSLSNMLIQSTIIGINNATCPGGSAVIDGNAAATNLEGFAYVATNSVYQASVTFTSQHHGAKKYKRIGTVMRCCYFVTALVAITAAAILLIFRHPLLGLYIQDGNEIALETAYTRFYINIAPYVTLAFMEVGSGVLRGLGKSTLSTVISLLGSCVFRLLWIYLIFPLCPQLWMVYLSYPISWSLTALTHLTVSMIVRRRCMRMYPEPENVL